MVSGAFEFALGQRLRLQIFAEAVGEAHQASLSVATQPRSDLLLVRKK